MPLRLPSALSSTKSSSVLSPVTLFSPAQQGHMSHLT
jgi:hypothetical protein